MSGILIQNPTIINEGASFKGDLLIMDEIISAIGPPGQVISPAGTRIIDATGLILIPGVIDDHVHFREPGLTYKGDIFSETRAAAAGGVTSFMDMPNTIPQTITLKDLENKYITGSERSLINYSFYIGATGDNLADVIKADPHKVCGIKLFMGSSTGNMLVDNEKSLKELFSKAILPVAVHCEDEPIIKKNMEIYRKKYGDDVPANFHSLIRSRESCYKSSLHAITLAKEFNTRLHILHLSTADEMKLFNSEELLQEKRITCEACVHHLWFDDADYDDTWIKVKDKSSRQNEI